MRKEVTTYLQTRLTDFSDFRTPEDIEFTHLGTLKTLLSEMLILIKEQRSAREEIKGALDFMRQGSSEAPPVQQPLGGRWKGSSVSNRSDGPEAVKVLQAGMESLAAELLCLKTVIQEHAAELRQTLSASQSRQGSPALSRKNSSSSALEAPLSERRRRHPRRDWGPFILTGSGSGRNTVTASSNGGMLPATSSIGSYAIAVPTSQIDGTSMYAAAQLSDQGCRPWADASRTHALAVTTFAPRRNSGMCDGRNGGMCNGNNPEIVSAQVAVDQAQWMGAAAQAAIAGKAPLEISVPMLPAADRAGGSSNSHTQARRFQQPDMPSSSAPKHAVPQTETHLPAVTRESVELTSAAFEGRSIHLMPTLQHTNLP